MTIKRLQAGKRMSQAVIHNGTVYLAGQVADDLDSGIEQQTREVLGNLERLLDLAGTDKNRLLSVTIYLKHVADFAGMNAVWDKWLPKGVAPARATVEANLCEPRILIEAPDYAHLPRLVFALALPRLRWYGANM